MCKGLKEKNRRKGNEIGGLGWSLEGDNMGRRAEYVLKSSPGERGLGGGRVRVSIMVIA